MSNSKDIAVISRKRVFDIVMKDIAINSTFNFIKVECIEDVKGRQFCGYIILYDAYSISNFQEIIDEIKLRTVA